LVLPLPDFYCGGGGVGVPLLSAPPAPGMVDDRPEPDDGSTRHGVVGCWPLRIFAASLAEQAGWFALAPLWGLLGELGFGACAKAGIALRARMPAIIRESFLMRSSPFGGCVP
jgi:hypothetical protein